MFSKFVCCRVIKQCLFVVTHYRSMNKVESNVAKWDIAHHEQFLNLPKCFQKLSAIGKILNNWKKKCNYTIFLTEVNWLKCDISVVSIQFWHIITIVTFVIYVYFLYVTRNIVKFKLLNKENLQYIYIYIL